LTNKTTRKDEKRAKIQAEQEAKNKGRLDAEKAEMEKRAEVCESAPSLLLIFSIHATPIIRNGV